MKDHKQHWPEASAAVSVLPDRLRRQDQQPGVYRPLTDRLPAVWKDELEAFKAIRKKHLMYQ